MSTLEELLDAARRGDGDAFAMLFEAARGNLLALARNELPEALHAKVAPSDIVQETAVDAQRGFPRFSGVTLEECFAWLRSILRNNVVDAIRCYERSRKRGSVREWSLASEPVHRQARLVEMLHAGPDGAAIRRETAASLAAAIALLPEDYRDVLRLRYWSGLSFTDIGQRMNRSPDAVRKLWYRAIERLQADMADDNPSATSGSDSSHTDGIAVAVR